METWHVVVALVAVAIIGFGYLGSTGAVAKGYSRYPFWVLATFLLLPTMVLIIFLPDRTRQATD